MAAELPAVLGQLLGAPEVELVAPKAQRVDAMLTALENTFVVEVTRSGAAGPVSASAARALSIAREHEGPSIPMVAVPFMGQSGRDACERAGVSWFDFSGNARIIAPGIRIIIDGKPNRFRSVGRPANAFATKSARVTRWLLMHPGESFTQRDIAGETDISEGLVSRVVSRLEGEHYVKRDGDGRVLVDKPGLLLDAWRDAYRFDRHRIIRGHVAARSGDALSRLVSDTLRSAGVEYAATGLAAAWQLTHFAGFRTATFYVGGGAATTLEEVGFREEERGANLWLVEPNDVGVLQGTAEREGVRCVHPVQVVVDLDSHPERSTEAAERLRSEVLGW